MSVANDPQVGPDHSKFKIQVSRLPVDMLLVRTVAEVREWRKRAQRSGERVALVPTLGALHEGHISLVAIARENADRTALSIFVNPLQFGPKEDFSKYPRDLEGDLARAKHAKVDLVFAPSVAEVYPDPEPAVVVEPVRGADVLCGASRPGHFRGVLTVVAKLFGIFTPDVAVFGKKDYQQLTLIRRMVEDLSMPVDIVSGATLREAGGLAMSSRNRYLSPTERSQALLLHAALRECEALFERGERDASVYRRRLQAIEEHGPTVEYGEVVDPRTLESLDRVKAGAVCLIAARVGATRLIDNLILPDEELLPSQ